MIGRRNCPNILPGAVCVDPDCAYCKIAEAEQPHHEIAGGREPTPTQPCKRTSAGAG